MQSSRLDTILSCVRCGSILADIGADHAYAAIEAVRTELSSAAVATDLREAPLQKAADNVSRAGLLDKITLLQTDGLEGIEAYKPTDIIIAGMGGELIADIISRSAYSKTAGVKLILQPMTSAYELRKFLYSSGFDISRELLCREDDHIYQIIVASYTGGTFLPTEVELHLGAYNISKHEDEALFREFTQKKEDKYETIYKGKLKAGLDTTYERSLLFLLQRILKGLGKS